MIIDTENIDTFPNSTNYDVCIAGGGVAGIVLAKTLAAKRKKILLLEGGGFQFSEISQNIYKGDIIGHDLLDLQTMRLRFLGGTSNHWGGWCRPLDAYDFRKKDYIEWSGWPIDRSDLSPFLKEASDILEVGKLDPNTEPLKGSSRNFKESNFLFSPNVNFKNKYKDMLESSEQIDLYLNANVIDIPFDSTSGCASSFVFRSYRENSRLFHAKADNYILALGGIENARALLNAGRNSTNSAIASNDLVGRFFMDHPHCDIGAFISIDDEFYGQRKRLISPTEIFLNEHKIGNFSLRLTPSTETVMSYKPYRQQLKHSICKSDSDIVRDFIKTVRPSFECSTKAISTGSVVFVFEQAPNYNSRVELSQEKDRFGLPRTALNWQFMPIDKKTIRVGALEFAKYFAANNFGRIQYKEWIFDEGQELPDFNTSQNIAYGHHTGTTRMGVSPKTGVVDENGKVFGCGNLYIAGSSVFSTSGHANPTLTIVQLALRLANHLNSA